MDVMACFVLILIGIALLSFGILIVKFKPIKDSQDRGYIMVLIGLAQLILGLMCQFNVSF
jgi:hypothetical protein